MIVPVVGSPLVLQTCWYLVIEGRMSLEVMLLMTRFHLMLPVDSKNVTKNRTDHWMHMEGPQIYQIMSLEVKLLRALR